MDCPPAFQSLVAATVLLPERFRGGCSFGAGGAMSGQYLVAVPVSPVAA